MCTQTSQVWCGLIIVHSNRLFVLLSALRAARIPPPSPNEPLQKYFLIDRGYLLRNPFAPLCYCQPLHKRHVWLFDFNQAQSCLLKAICDSQRHLSLPLPTWPLLLCPIASLSCSKALSSFNETSMGKQAVWGPRLLTGFIDWARQKK